MNKAIITADVIHSSRMTNKNREILYKHIGLILKNVEKKYGVKSEIYRGDSFQCVVDNIALALRIALQIKTYLRGINPSEIVDIAKRNQPDNVKTIYSPVWVFDVRMAIGIGEVKFRASKIIASDGEAFQLSGRALDELKNSRYRFAINTNDNNKNALNIESKLLDTIVNKATALQCQVIFLKLSGDTEIQIAKKLKIKQAAVNQRSVSGNWNVINEMITYFENLYSNE